MSKGLRKAYSVISTVPVILVVLLAILLVGVRLVGLKPYTVLSGSMEPNYHVGSLIYVKKIDPSELAVNDPVTFMLSDGTVVTHRIIEVILDKEDPSVIRFRTQGDANNIPDGDTLHSNNIIGKPFFTIPYLGYLAHFVQNPPGRYIAIAFCLLLVIIVFLPDLWSGSKDESKGVGDTADPANTSAEAKDTPEAHDSGAIQGDKP